MGISFQVPHHMFGGCGTAPKYGKHESSPTEQGFLSTDPFLCLSSIPFVAAMGAVTSKVVWWVANLKRDPHTPKTVFREECFRSNILIIIHYSSKGLKPFRRHREELDERDQRRGWGVEKKVTISPVRASIVYSEGKRLTESPFSSAVLAVIGPMQATATPFSPFLNSSP